MAGRGRVGVVGWRFSENVAVAERLLVNGADLLKGVALKISEFEPDVASEALLAVCKELEGFRVQLLETCERIMQDEDEFGGCPGRDASARGSEQR